MTNPYKRKTSETLRRQGLAPSKRFGQNFLVHRRTAEAIVNAGKVEKEETIVEVGVGLGALTHPLAERAKRVCGFEIDSGLIRLHREQKELPRNVTLIHEDILKADFTELVKTCGNTDGKLKLIANLPYSISNPFIFKLIDNATLMDTVTVMLQKEVALRLTASPGNKEYGVPTILLASCATVEQHFVLKPEEFHPRPKIDSMVITLNFNKRAPGIPTKERYDFMLFKEVVRTTFNQRRKTIGNTLNNCPRILLATKNSKTAMKEITHKALKEADIDARKRPETLDVIEFITLTENLSQIIPPIEQKIL